MDGQLGSAETGDWVALQLSSKGILGTKKNHKNKNFVEIETSAGRVYPHKFSHLKSKHKIHINSCYFHENLKLAILTFMEN